MAANSDQPVTRFHIPAQTGTAFMIRAGQTARIIDVEGEQVADMFCVSKDEHDELLSSGHTMDYNGKIFLTQGDVLYSSKSNPMFSIVADQVGKHIMLYTPCTQEMFARSYGIKKAHPNCFDNLAKDLGAYGIRFSPHSIPLNIFMNIEIHSEGAITIHPPRSKAGDYIDLKAEMDLIVALSACSAGLCNNFKWTPIEVEIFDRL